MKKLPGKVKVLLCLLGVLCMTGCGQEPVSGTTVPEMSTAPTQTTAPAEPETTAGTKIPEETTVPATEIVTEPAETEEEDGLPYLQRIDRADQSIYEGPGYDYVFAGTVRERGTYTIVEEKWDYEGNLWGKLKSGAGWIDLTQIRSEAYAKTLISANFADENLLLHGEYHHCPADESEYCIPIAIRAYGKLQDVALFAYEFSGEDYVMGEDFFTLPELTEEMPLVAELAFPGDMSMYGIRFVDEHGETHIYSIYISGRNGALVLAEA